MQLSLEMQFNSGNVLKHSRPLLRHLQSNEQKIMDIGIMLSINCLGMKKGNQE